MNAHVNTVGKVANVEIASPLRQTKRASTAYSLIGKRFFDVFAVIAAAPIVIPVVAILAILVALDGKSPIYVQKRVGVNGKVFKIYKLRSMVANADAALKTYLSANPDAKAEWDAKQKLMDDPRITRVGSFIRKTSLDELPQLMNVLLGDMSLVGPRPMMTEQRDLYPGSEYYEMRPGITGYWQISDRNDVNFAQRASFDADYYKDLSLKTDLSVLFATVNVVLKATGR